ncbi:hypothetical protein LNTAR_21760 [Lentisphaera araneosa HTCC2155]|uniref:Type II secretion system protein n=1 Tax=Lentisphaera araneosa HTCC2155 TaxID=313628 RepID=A6DM86_9BACT|nr:type II secretion system protein [Lentisphaera araneosa]EDM27384.1 hypothetical protein LNTAR_21760 [Lentisphaera araneosa HTCC2155]
MSNFKLRDALIVIAILGIITSVVLSKLSVARDKGMQKSCISNLKQISTSMLAYYSLQDTYVYMPKTLGNINSAADPQNAYNMWDLEYNNFNCYAKHDIPVNKERENENSYSFCEPQNNGITPGIKYSEIESHERPVAGDKTVHTNGRKATIFYADGHVETQHLNALQIKYEPKNK